MPPPLSACQKTYVEMSPLKFWRGSSRGRQPASSGIECPECLAWQGVQRARRGLFRRTAAGKYRHFSGCRKTSVQTNPPEFWRGSSRGRQPASSGIECPERLAWKGVQRAQRGLFCRVAAGKYRHLPGVEKVFGLFRRLVRARPNGRAPLLCKLAGYARSSSPRMASNTASPSWHMTSRTVPSSRVSSRAS